MDREPGFERRGVWAVMVVLAIASLFPASAHAGKRITVQGRVLLETGEGLPDWPVLLIATQRYFEFSGRATGGKVATIARTRSDANGYFSFDVPRKRGFHHWFLRFVDPEEFDAVKYRIPDDVEITAMARRGRVAAIDKTVRLHPDWPEVERLIAEAGGEGTPKGKILRTIGLPEKSVTTASGEEEWWYFTRGIMYTFRGSEPIGSRQFEPVQPPPGEGTG